MSVPFLKISVTERQGFKRCRRQWNYGSYGRMNLESLHPDTRLWFGHGVHRALERFYGYHEPLVETWTKWVDEKISAMQREGVIHFSEELEGAIAQRELGKGMLTAYLDFAKQRDDFEVIATEQEFELPIRDPSGKAIGLLVGRFDGLVKTADGKLWLLEHKTSADKWSSDNTIYDDQLTGYLWAAEQLFGHPLEGVYFNVLRKRLPVEPKLLANGKGLSRAKDIDTTYETYYATILKHGFAVSDYEDILEALREKGNTFFYRERFFMSPREVDLWGLRLVSEYLDMAGNPRIYPNFTWDCAWDCDYRSLCRAEQAGDDWRFIAEIQFRERDLSKTVYQPLTLQEIERIKSRLQEA